MANAISETADGIFWRSPVEARGDCIVPEISRAYNFGESGTLLFLLF